MKIENLGPIKNLEIDLSKLNIFIGKNSVGKTVAAYAVYFFINWFNEEFIANLVSKDEIEKLIIDGDSVIYDISEIENKVALQASEQFNKLDYSKFKNLYNSSKIYTKGSKIKVTPKDIKTLTIAKNMMHGWFYSWAYVEDEKTENIRSSENLSTDNIHKSNQILSRPVGNKIETTYKVLGLDSTVKFNHKVQLESFEKNLDEALKLINLGLKNVLFKSWVLSEPVYLPAERIGINVFRPDLNLSRLNSSSPSPAPTHFLNSSEDSNNSYKRYALPIENYIKFINNYVKRLNNDVLEVDNDKLISKLIPGKFNYDQENDEIKYKLPNSEELDFEVLSSSLKSIFGLDLFLKSGPEGRWLIFDEPEMNLHPANQKIIADLLFKLVKNNVKLVISTHSDYFIKELINCVLKDKLNEQKENEINVYEFKDGTAVKINNIFDIDESVNNFDDTTREINKEYYKLVNELEPEEDDDLEDFQEKDDE